MKFLIWLKDNKKWFFNGAGVAIATALWIYFTDIDHDLSGSYYYVATMLSDSYIPVTCAESQKSSLIAGTVDVIYNNKHDISLDGHRKFCAGIDNKQLKLNAMKWDSAWAIQKDNMLISKINIQDSAKSHGLMELYLKRNKGDDFILDGNNLYFSYDKSYAIQTELIFIKCKEKENCQLQLENYLNTHKYYQ